MIILVINSGSSSLKFQLIDMDTHKRLVRGVVEKIGSSEAIFSVNMGEEYLHREYLPVENHHQAVKIALQYVLHHPLSGITDISEIKAIGHRVVHGGDTFSKAELIEDWVLEKIQLYAELAPLHNPAHLAGIKACGDVLPGIPQVAVFDTAFHQTLEPPAYMYGLPYEYYEKYKIRRYGAHGTSHKYVSQKAAEFLGRPLSELKMITCHLGNGASLCAIQNGKAVETSMGFTPLEGLMMGTRTGNIDPAAVLFLMDKEGLSTAQMDNLLNKQSGLLGVSGISNDFRDIQEAIDRGDKRAIIARYTYIHRVKMFIGSYAAIMNGLDVLVFTAGIGENDIPARRLICENMDFLGISVNRKRNHVQGELADISADDARVKTLVVPTDEEMAIAQETMAVLGK